MSQSPHRPALAYGDTELTYRELHEAVDRLAARLGERAGERVAVIAANVPALVVALFGAWRAGATVVPLSARLRSFELRRVFADAQPSAAISLAAHGGFSLAQELDALGEQIPTLSSGIVVDELGEAARGAAVAGDGEAQSRWTQRSGGDHVHVGHDRRAEGRADVPRARRGRGAATRRAAGRGCAGGMRAGRPRLARVRAGVPAVLPGGRRRGGAGGSTTSLQPLVQAVQRHEARVLHGSPALFARLLKTTTELPVKSGFTAGSSCPPKVLEELDRREARVLNMYGMTEIGAASSCRPDDPPEVRHHTVGRPLPGYEFRVVGPGGRAKGKGIFEGDPHGGGRGWGTYGG